MNPHANSQKDVRVRMRIVYAILIVIFVIFLLRAFYLQIVKYHFYHQAALSDQLKEYEIPAERGAIKAHMGEAVVPIVLNEKLYTIYADPSMIKDTDKTADSLAQVFGGNVSDYKSKISNKDSRYVILAKKVAKDKKEAIFKYKYAGIAAEEQHYRTYPNGQLASQLLGFVNNESKGVYGVEQALNNVLSGTPGQLKAVTDINGVPLAASKGNVSQEPVTGDDVVLTIDVGMQKQLEDILKKGAEKAKAPAASAIIMDPTGAVKAMGNFPTYDPSKYGDVEDSSLFNNAAVSHAIEVGSIMKTLTSAAALDTGAVNKNTTYYDPSSYKIDDFTVKNIEEDGGPGVKGIRDILNLSLNTGATWELMQMGGGKLNQQGRQKWYDYMVNHYMFGKETGIEQGYEATGYVPKPEDNGAGINLTYANTSFGQAMTGTTIQMAAAMTALVNGGTYYQPRLVDSYIDTKGKIYEQAPKVVKTGVVSQKTTDEILPMLEYVVQEHYFKPSFNQDQYAVGGKTGTAQIANPEGGYFADDYNGTYLGFVGGDKAEYVIAVFVYKPRIAGYAGSQAAQPIFGDLAHMLINNFGVTPKTQ